MGVELFAYCLAPKIEDIAIIYDMPIITPVPSMKFRRVQGL